MRSGSVELELVNSVNLGGFWIGFGDAHTTIADGEFFRCFSGELGSCRERDRPHNNIAIIINGGYVEII